MKRGELRGNEVGAQLTPSGVGQKKAVWVSNLQQDRRGQERLLWARGQDRRGQERKGEDRTEQERTGQERTGEDKREQERT